MKRQSVLAMLLAVTASSAAVGQDTLADGFRDPPKSARPNVWWHWMNGNITEDGIAKDLAWMKRTGIGGVQTFDANLLTPPIVPKRLGYMTPEWRKAFRFAAETAAELDLDLTIAASPGWSETGGPWVRPSDGIKKLVWSETVIEGGKPFRGRLSPPPSVSGPFQELSAPGDAIAAVSGEGFKPPVYYADVGAFAYPIRLSAPIDRPRAIVANGEQLDILALTDASLITGEDIARGSADAPTTLSVDFEKPQIIRSLSFYAVGGAEKFGAPFFLPRLEASDDGAKWRKVADLTLTPVPSTIGFAPVKAAHFRIVMAHNPSGGITGFTPAPGADIALLAGFLTPKPKIRIAQLALSGEDRVNQFEAKAAFATVLAYAPLDAEASTAAGAVDVKDVVNLTSRMRADGGLDWTPPPGRWRIVRLGSSLTGQSNHPAPPEATGLEVDKLDARAVRDYLEHYIDSYREAVGPDLLGARGVGALLTDSTEVGAFNWTPQMGEQFRRLRGYDPLPWLPTLTGAVIESRAASDGFLYDFRRTIGELHASEHYGTVAKVAHEHGLKVYGEALEDRRPSLGDDMAMRRHSDYPMAALWTYPRGGTPRPTLLGDMKGASSVAHVYGQNVVAAESMTSALQPWAHSPADLRRVIDLEFLHGVNKPSIHTSVHQPIDDKLPGVPLFIFGQYFNRLDTWSAMARPWIDYIARNSFLLQQGRNHADVAYFYGEDSPLTALFADGALPDTPRAYAYDFINADVVLNVLKAEGQEVTSPSGARYRAIYLGGTSRSITLPVLRRLAELADAGATIIGEAPHGTPSLADDKAEFSALVKRMWSGQPITRLGNGQVMAGTTIEAALQKSGLAPDFSFLGPSDSDVRFVHRKLPDGDTYFVNNRLNRAETIEARFRVAGMVPELWRADTGARTNVSYRTHDGVTHVPLEMAAEDSFFIVFRKVATAPSAEIPKPVDVAVAMLDGPWNVAFEPNRGAPASLKFEALGSLSEQADPAVKYFSGIATYSRSFELPKGIRSGQPLLLDLGTIGDVAEVRVNGKAVGTVWHAPYRLEIGHAVKRGKNRIEIKVANLWVNRLIGDAQPGATKVTSTTLPTYTAGAPLRPSGLIGPVTLLTRQINPVRKADD